MGAKPYRNINVDESTEKVIAVLGSTGVGKSSFINSLTGKNECKIGNSHTSTTKELKIIDFQFQGIKYYIIDTPGLYDSDDQEEEIISTLKN